MSTQTSPQTSPQPPATPPPGKTSLTYPAPRHALSGMVKVRGMWYAMYTAGGKAKRHSLRTTDSLTACLRVQEFRKALDALGAVATERGRKRGTANLAAGDRTFVYYRAPWIVKDGKKTVGCFATEEEAMAARDKHYGLEEVTQKGDDA